MGNDVHDCIQAIYISAHPNGFFSIPGIDFRDGHAIWIHRFHIPINFFHEFRQGVDTEINPLSKGGIAEIARF